MKFYTLSPTHKLSNVVRYFWVFEGKASKTNPYIHRTLASNCPELLFHYKGTFNELTFHDDIRSSFTTGIHAQTNQYRRFIVKEEYGMFGVFLYPYALSLLFNIPAIALTNQMPCLTDILNKADFNLTERMVTAANNKIRYAIITNFLETKLKQFKHPEIASVVRTIINEKGQVSINKISEQFPLSTRQFERNFKEQVGFSPKAFARLTRFNAIIALKQKPNNSLTEIAYDFGYYDQSHFIHDFKSFSGYNPRTYFSGKATDLI